MTRTLDKKVINLVDIKKVLRDSLSLDDDVNITKDTQIISLGAEPIDFLDIYHRLGMNFSNYISGEKFNNNLKLTLKEMFLDASPDYALHLSKLAMSQTTNEFINQLSVKDLIEIHNYRGLIKHDRKI